MKSGERLGVDVGESFNRVVEKLAGHIKEMNGYNKKQASEILAACLPSNIIKQAQSKRVLYYPFGGADVFWPFVLFPNLDHLIMFGQDKFGECNDLSDQMKQMSNKRKNIMSPKGWAPFDLASSYRSLSYHLGMLILIRIVGTLGGVELDINQIMSDGSELTTIKFKLQGKRRTITYISLHVHIYEKLPCPMNSEIIRKEGSYGLGWRYIIEYASGIDAVLLKGCESTQDFELGRAVVSLPTYHRKDVMIISDCELNRHGILDVPNPIFKTEHIDTIHISSGFGYGDFMYVGSADQLKHIDDSLSVLLKVSSKNLIFHNQMDRILFFRKKEEEKQVKNFNKWYVSAMMGAWGRR